MRKDFHTCIATITLTVSIGIGALAATACDAPDICDSPEVCDAAEDLPGVAGREGEPPSAEPPPSVPGSLADEQLPPITDLYTYKDVADPDPMHGIIRDREKAVMLGKALFWDMQAGSDGQACASCHFTAGADNRARNQLSPGLLAGDDDFDKTRSGNQGRPNYELVAADFPFHVKKDPEDRRSKVLFDTNDVASSQGVHKADFEAVKPGKLDDICDPESDDVFEYDDINLRRVEPRNTPTVVNAAFNYRNFWDGRANNIFNGVDPFGLRNKKAEVLAVKDGEVVKRKLRLINSSLASQAVGPLLNDFEMSCAGRSFQNVAHKLLRYPTIPLAFQKVATDDSVLGGLARVDKGLNTTYKQLIEEAFHEKFWKSDDWFDADKNKIAAPNKVSASKRFSLMESNFSMIWGLAIQEYERTLISTNSPFNRYSRSESPDLSALNEEQIEGLNLFMGQGKCINCHATAMFTKASTLHLIPEAEEGGLVERMMMSEENHHYAVKTDAPFRLFPGALGLKGYEKDSYDLVLNVEGTPTLVGGVITPGAASGTIELKSYATKAICKYKPTTFSLGADQTKSRDARLHAELEYGTGCPQELRIGVVDDVYFGGGTWLDFIVLDDGYGGFSYSAFGKAQSLDIREPALYDNGFYNIGVRPTKDDIGVGGKDPFGNPLSFTEQFVLKLLGKYVPDPFKVNPCKFEIPWVDGLDSVLFPGGFKDKTDCEGHLSYMTGLPIDNADNNYFIKNLRRAVKGAFKTPTLHNVAVTAPYMHSGGMSTLEQVVDFYNRGGDFPNNPELDPDIRPLGLKPEQEQALVAFLRSLTDPDLVFEREPFDHPQLFVPNGLYKVKDNDDDGVADENLFEVGLEVPAVGKTGRLTDDPIKTFLELEDPT